LSFIDRPQSVFARRALFQVHLWLGLIAGSYIFVVCMSGAALVFRIDMQRTLHPDLFTASSAGPAANPVAIMESVTRSYPGEKLSGIDAPTTERPTYLAYTSSGEDFRALLLDPVTATMLGEIPKTSFVRTLQDLHFDLLGGRPGRIVNGIGATALTFMCVTGLVIWWPGRGSWRRSFLIDWRRHWKRIIWDLHSAVGGQPHLSDYRHTHTAIEPARRTGAAVVAGTESMTRYGMLRVSTWRAWWYLRAKGPHFSSSFPQSAPHRSARSVLGVSRSVFGCDVDAGHHTRAYRRRRRHGLGRPAARGELRRERNPCGVAPPWHCSATALHHGVHHVVDTRRAHTLGARHATGGGDREAMSR
jgi:hypothetical protein